MILKGRPTDYRPDGMFYCAANCSWCGELFYTHALMNIGMGFLQSRCPWCRGECSAAAQDHYKVAIEAQYSVGKDGL